ncbi:ribosome silencing factor [Paucibacter sp. JuS9]|uniref:ribosome silencing factor n=1 Tax=Roseateles TaxID=93681 RepID=UPI002FE5C1B3
MDIRKLQRAIVDGLEDVKAQNIQVFNTEHLSPLFERVIIASGTSNRQTKALASSVRVTVKERGMQVMRTEGEDNGEWIIVDCGAAVVHVMQPAIRDYYHLEEIWGGKPVKLKLGDGEVRLVKASEPEDEAPAKPAKKNAGKAPAKKTAPSAAPSKVTGTKTAAAKKAAPAAKKAAPAAKKVAAAKPPLRKPAGKTAAKTPATRTPATRTPATRTPATRTPAARTPATRVAAEAPVKTIKVGAAKPAAKKAAPAKKAVTKTVGRKTAVAAKPAAKPAAKKAAPAKKSAR